jgi:hypothetical protein
VHRNYCEQVLEICRTEVTRSVGMFELIPLSRDALVDPVAPVALPVLPVLDEPELLPLLIVPRTSTWLLTYFSRSD